MNKLRYKSPAKNWHEALPLGNGITGAMVLGGRKTERIFFNDSERTVHSLCNDHVSRTKKSELISRVQKLDRVHNLFNYDRYVDGGAHLSELPDFEQEKYNQDFWDNKFNERYNIYINNIKKFNKK